VFPFAEARPGRDGRVPSPDDLVEPAVRMLLGRKRLRRGAHVGFLAGVPLDTPGATNWLRVVEV